MLVDPVARATAARLLDGAIEVVETPLDDAWLRDSGPTFVLDDAGRLGAVDWVFNGWGRPRLGGVGAGRPGGRRGGRGGRRRGPAVAARERGRRDPRRRRGHRPAHGDGAARPAPQPVGRPRGWRRSSPARSRDARGVAAARPHPRLRRYGTSGHVDICATIPSPAACCCTSSATPRTRTTRCRRSCAGRWRRPSTRRATVRDRGAARAPDPARRGGLRRLVLREPCGRQRRGDRLLVRGRPGRRGGARRARGGVPGAAGGVRRGPPDLRVRRRDPLHHAAAAPDAAGGGVRHGRRRSDQTRSGADAEGGVGKNGAVPALPSLRLRG